MDTAVRRARSTAADAIHRVDQAVSGFGRSKHRVLFEAASPLSLVVFQSVLDVMRHDDRIEFWFTTCDGAWTPDATFGPAGVTDRLCRHPPRGG